ncbi:hypothetical protein GCM10017620_02110 [Brevundimonas intermedia]|jgi:hypothetical protein|uniref:Uncharacterized protein n=1 Tax=Brevundimonas intermedia TaxID=74315 RepID=A0ABQ5T4A8_9CAUL|nr:hypothetical protein [Brevundimonas intermedia]GLK47238.1 hypothetical protein GCM10017620_02110 [Brevundimonas intermedia]
MDEISRIVERAGRSRRTGFDRPIVESYEQAAAIARDLAERLASLPWSDKALLISDVRMLETALKRRADTLRAGMSETSAEIIRLNRGTGAAGAYAAGGRLGARRRP